MAGTIRGFSGDEDFAVKAKLNRPNGIVKDVKNKVVYVADTMNHRIRKIDSRQVITTYVGSGSTGLRSCPSKSTYDNYLPATSSCLNTPMSLALDNDGNLYISNLLGNKIERVDKDTQRVRLILGQESVENSLYHDYLSGLRMNYKKDRVLKQQVMKEIKNEKLRLKVSKNLESNNLKQLEDKLFNLNLKNNFYSTKEIALYYPSSIYYNNVQNTLFISDSNHYLIYKMYLNSTLFENEHLVEIVAGNLLEETERKDGKKRMSEEGLSLHTSLPLISSIKGDNRDIIYMTEYSNRKIKLLIDNNYI